MTNGMLLGHIVIKEGIAMDTDKFKAILEAPKPQSPNAPTPTNAKVLSIFLGQIKWHSRMIRYLAYFATPVHAVVHNVSRLDSSRKRKVKKIECREREIGNGIDLYYKIRITRSRLGG